MHILSAGKAVLATALVCSLVCASPGESSELLWKEAHNVQLDNGLTVLIKESRTLPVVSVHVWVKVGSVNETAKTSGLSHFLEHLIFKGSAKYPGPEISHRVETQGGIINAATSKEFTHFYIDTQKKGMDDAVRILADAMSNAVFPADEVEKERPVVIEEIRRHGDNPGAVLYDLFNEAAFLKTPYRSSIIGTEEIIRTVPRDEIIAYYKNYYVPANMVLTIVGDCDPETTLRLVRDTFGLQPGSPVPAQPELTEPDHKPVSLRRDKDVEHAYWFGGFLGPTIMSDEQFAADVTATILGNGRSSRLFRRIREELQLAYSVDASFWSQRGSGMFAFSAVFAPEKEREIIDEISRQVELLKSEGPTEDELKRVREVIKAQWAFGRETYHDQASMLGYWHMQGNPAMIDRYMEGIEKVGAKDVVAFLEKYSGTMGLNQALLMPSKAE